MLLHFGHKCFPIQILSILLLCCIFGQISGMNSKTLSNVVNSEMFKKKMSLLFGKSVETNTSACENFYEFAIAQNIDQATKLIKLLKTDICMLEQLNGNLSNPSTAVQKAFLFRDKHWKNKEEKISNIELLEEIKSFGSCPLLDYNWTPNSFNLSHVLHSIARSTGKMPIFKLDMAQSSDGTIMLSIKPRTELAKKYNDLFGEDGTLNANSTDFEQMKVAAKLDCALTEFDITANQSIEELGDTIEQIVNVSIQAVKLQKSTLAIEQRCQNTHKVRFSELDRLFPKLGASFFLDHHYLLPEVRNYLSFIDPLIQIEYKETLIKLVDFFFEVDPALLSNWLCTQYLDDHFEYNSSDTSTILNSESTEAENSTDVQKEAKSAIYNTTLFQKHFPRVLDHLLVSNCMDPLAIESVKQMVGQIRWVVRRMIKETSWFDVETKRRAISKINQLKAYVGVLDLSSNVRTLDTFYSDLRFDETDSYRRMEQKMDRFINQRVFKLIVQPERLIWIMPAYGFIYNAFHIINLNSILISGYYMSTFDYTANNAVRFGSLGFPIAHEMFHGFSVLGTSYDENGVKRNWLLPSSQVEFKRRTHCLVDQFNAIKDQNGKNFNGSLFLDESVADVAGLRAAYHTYRAQEAKANKTFDSKFENDRQFFTNYARTEWLIGFLKKHLPSLLSSSDDDPHPPTEFRINAVLKNMPEFARAFNCLTDSPMNPTKKCRIY